MSALTWERGWRACKHALAEGCLPGDAGGKFGWVLNFFYKHRHTEDPIVVAMFNAAFGSEANWRSVPEARGTCSVSMILSATRYGNSKLTHEWPIARLQCIFT